ncbi:VOC family protein [Nocardia sp. NPDC050412]|uniref:VOC family protein n=1 Tax=Nocardia sp. NPDC050412 TaxID=3364320 RepID=UPI00378BAABF
MSCRITELVIDCADPQRLADFWCEVLGYVELGWEGDDHLEIGPPGTGFGGPQPTLLFGRSTEPKRGKLRLHLDVNPTDRDQEAELERLLAAGARKVDIGQPGAATWHVLTDPEGNEFCLLRRRVEAVESDPNTR